MKRLVILALVVAFLVGTVGMVKAAQLTISGGDFRVHGNYVTNPNFDKDHKDDVFNLYQRFRVNFNFVANENLRVVTQLQFGQPGDLRWGSDGDNQLRRGTENARISFRQAYLQFNVPNTQVQVRAGHQWFVLPNTLGSHIWDARTPALVVSSPINDMVGVTLGYGRLSDPNWLGTDTDGDGFRDLKSADNEDMFFAILPVTLDGIAINPFVAYVYHGKRSAVIQERVTQLVTDPVTLIVEEQEVTAEVLSDKAMNTYFLGLNFTVDMFDPIVIMGDFNYGAQSKRASGMKGQSGWIADLAVAYKMDMMTPMIFGLYETGESRSSADPDRKGKRMPNLAPDLNFSSFGFAGSNFGGTSWYALPLQGPTGKWAVGLKITDISFMDKLSHQFLVAYYQGTNHSDLRDAGEFTTKDRAWEVNFDTSYQIYENLAAILELGYIGLNLSEDNNERSDDDSFKAALGFRYRF